MREVRCREVAHFHFLTLDLKPPAPENGSRGLRVFFGRVGVLTGWQARPFLVGLVFLSGWHARPGTSARPFFDGLASASVYSDLSK